MKPIAELARLALDIRPRIGGHIAVCGLLLATLACQRADDRPSAELPETAIPSAQTAGTPAPVSTGNAGASGESVAAGRTAAAGDNAGTAAPATDAGIPPAANDAAMPTAGHETATAGSGNAGTSGSAAIGGSDADPAGSGGAPATSAGGPAPRTGPLTVYIAGDSTVSTYADTGRDDDQAGWGQMLPEQVTKETRVDNRAIGGRTARRFIDDGRLDEILEDIQAGDYLLIQFGTNDGNRSATYVLNGQTIPYYLEPNTDFKTYLEKYIAGARSHAAIPVLVTPPPRNSAYCTGGNGTGAHAQAMRDLAQAEGLILADLNQKSVDYLKAICPEPSPANFYLQRSDGTVDGTHFQERGARILAGFVADELRGASVGFVTPSKQP